jgi:hypothetical protein
MQKKSIAFVTQMISSGTISNALKVKAVSPSGRNKTNCRIKEYTNVWYFVNKNRRGKKS